MNAGPGGGGAPRPMHPRMARLLRQRMAPPPGPAVHWGGGMKHSLGQVINYERAHGNKNIHQFLAQHPGLVQAFAQKRARGMYQQAGPLGPQGYHPDEGDSSVAGPPPGAPGSSGVADTPPPGMPPGGGAPDPYSGVPGSVSDAGGRPGPMPPGLMPPGILSGAGGSSLPNQSNDVYEMQKKMALLGQGGIGAGFLGGPISAAGAGPMDPRQLAIQKAMAAFVAKRGAY